MVRFLGDFVFVFAGFCVVEVLLFCGSDVFGYRWFSDWCMFGWVMLLMLAMFCVL